jgi:hypothetical protein
MLQKENRDREIRIEYGYMCGNWRRIFDDNVESFACGLREREAWRVLEHRCLLEDI